MNELKIFNNNEFGEIRVLEKDNEPWFIGKDVASILGYKDTSDAMKRHVDSEDKLSRGITDSGQNRQMYVINESGREREFLDNAHLLSCKKLLIK